MYCVMPNVVQVGSLVNQSLAVDEHANCQMDPTSFATRAVVCSFSSPLAATSNFKMST